MKVFNNVPKKDVHVKLTDKEGKILFDEVIEFPEDFDYNECLVVASRYLVNSAKKKETSFFQLVERVSKTIALWAAKLYNWTKEQEEQFAEQLAWFQVNRYIAFNSPVYFNVGLDGPQICHACHILDVDDTLDSIYDHIKKEMQIFRYGAGAGINLSTLRSSKEKVKGSGFSSGVVSWLKIQDISAAMVKSGGRLRRAAKLARLNITHPDIEEFIWAKAKQEEKARVLMKNKVIDDSIGEIPLQATNVSVGITDEFMQAVREDKEIILQGVHEKDLKIPVKARKLWNDIVQAAWECGDPGLQFHDTINRYNTTKHEISCSNPCTTGDTYIAVADGRGFVPIKQLAEEGKDVPIYTFDYDTRKAVIAMGRNPRKTREKAKIVKVYFDNGSYIRCTPDHKFITKNRGIVEAKDLRPGDSLVVRNKSLLKAKFNLLYWKVPDSNLNEHRLLYKTFIDSSIQKHIHVHHKNGNSLDNRLENLEALSASEHLSLHMSGDRNPMRAKWWFQASEEEKERYRRNMLHATSGLKNGRAYKITNDEFYNLVLEFARSAGHPITSVDWYKYAKDKDLPGGGRYRQINKVVAKVNEELFGFPADKWGKRGYAQNARRYWWLKDNYDLPVEFDYDTGEIYVIRNCEWCGGEYKVPWNRREVAFCSRVCSQRASREKNPRVYNKQKHFRYFDVDSMRATNAQKSLFLLTEFILDYLQNKNKFPTWKECNKFLKENCPITDLRSLGFKNLSELIHYLCDIYNVDISNFEPAIPSLAEVANLLQEAGTCYNHKVVAVEDAGYEDVYTITVDKYHNFGILLANEFDLEADSIRLKENPNLKHLSYHICFTLQCGEYFGSSNTSCNLASINVLRFVEEGNKFNTQLFESAIRTLTRALTAISYYADYPLPELQKGSHRFHNIGIGLTNLGAFLINYKVPYDSKEAEDVVENVYAFMKVVSSLESQEIAKEVSPYPEYTERHAEVYEIYQDRALALKPLSISGLSDLHNTTVDYWAAFDVEVPMANAQVLAQAPTGTISFMMGAETTGIEPYYSLVTYKRLMDGSTIALIPKVMLNVMKDYLNDSEIEYVIENGVLPKDCPKELKDIIRVAVSDDEEIVADNMRRLNIAAAAQKFISSGISITYNLPNSASPEDVEKIYLAAYEKGLKGVTVFRDGCKAIQVLYTKQEEDIKPIKAKRVPLPDYREGKVKKFRVGTAKGYLITGEYKDGTLGELFIKIAKEGSTLSGLADSFALVVSIALQYGVPLEILIKKLKNTRFEPAGFTGDQDIPSATSIIDYIVKYLEKTYLSNKKDIAKLQSSGMICGKCGGEMLKKGSCFVCQSCGESSGACE